MTCHECGGVIIPSPPAGRTCEVARGIRLPIPEEYLIPTCQGCGNEVWSPELSDAVDGALARARPRV